MQGKKICNVISGVENFLYGDNREMADLVDASNRRGIGGNKPSLPSNILPLPASRGCENCVQYGGAVGGGVIHVPLGYGVMDCVRTVAAPEKG